MSQDLGIDNDTLREIYTQVARIHQVDRAIQAGLSSGKFQFTYWPLTGQEGIPASIAPLVTSDDHMVTIYRGIHDQVAKGVPLKGLFAEALGRIDGVNKGKGGSPHISDPASGSMLTTAIVGAGAPIANGIALASKMRGTDAVTIVNFGDGATSIGAVHEAMNLAGLWKLPVIFLCQNNQMGEYTRIPDYTASKDFASRAAGYGFKGVILDGNDVVAFHKGMKDAIADARAGNGPVFVEARTIRLGLHAGVGDTNHLSKEDLAAAKETWPVPRTRKLLLDNGICTEEELAAIDAAAEAEVKEAIEWAMNCEPTGVDEMLLDVYADPTVAPRRGQREQRAAEEPHTGDTRELPMFQAIQDAQETALELDPDVFFLGEDIGESGGVFRCFQGLQEKYGERIRPTPIAEQAIMGAATGAAIMGLRPVAEIMFCDFMGVAMDQIANHTAKQRYMSGGKTHVPLTVRTVAGAGIGGFGAQHSQSTEAWLLHTPGLKVVYPSTPSEAKGLLLSCIFDDDPCVQYESMMLTYSTSEEVPVGDYRVPIGVAKVKREGADISLITYGWQVMHCLNAAEELAKEGISAEVLDLRTLMPLDYDRIFASVEKTGRALVVHAATEFCGLGAEIACTLNDTLHGQLKAPASRFGAAYAPIAFARPIETEQIPHAGTIAARVREMLK
ncbi:MAG: dehydrogenase [Halioglobus sp.]|nr:dehydrogenase [Halioglobus sp.]